MKKHSSFILNVSLATLAISCSVQGKKSPNITFHDAVKPAYTVAVGEPDGQMMNEENFWKIIADVKKGASLKSILNEFEPKDIVQFAFRYDSLMSMSYNWKLWGAAYVINGGCSDDCFEDFRQSLINQGKERFYSTLKDPESYINYIDSEELINERISYIERTPYVTYEVYQSKTGQELPRADFIKYELKGVPFDEATVDKQYPKLAKKFLSNH